MHAATKSSVSEATAIRPFKVNIPEAELKDLRSWAEAVCPNLAYFNEVDRGGHFAAWEEPKLMCQEIRAALKRLRP